VPQGLESVYNLGSRALDFRTIIRVLRYFDILEDRINIYIDAYANSMLEFARKISNVADETSKVAKTVRKELLGSGYYAKYRFEDIIGTSQSIVKMKKIAEKIAGTDLSVLIEGENGTGKELFASAIHNASQRAAEPFVAINLSALPDQLAESELFGYEEGAFTGAKKGGKIGLFQQAGGGTLFLDEIGDISLVMQGKLLRVLQEHEVMKVGGDRIIPVDVRIIAATNRNLKEMIKAGTFRQDLYYRLKECSIVIPALNQRREDIPLIAANWMKRKYGDTMELATDVVEDLAAQDWPGNVRELLNSLKFAVAVSSGNVVRAQDFPAWTYENAEKTKDDDTDEALMKMLSAVRTINGEGHIAGRAAVLRCIRQWDTGVTEYMVRKYIDRLIKEGLLTKNAGYGLGLTEKGNDKLAGTK
jgi:transcriptional regulator with PAS, ATPase and Fis domain